MNSSYLNKIDYSEIIKTICFIKNPKKIVEFGILDGFSLKSFVDNTNNCQIEAYDIFDEFIGNSASFEVISKFSKYKNIKIEYGDFYKKVDDFEDNSIDILHIDIANNANVYKFAIAYYLPKVKENGIILLEGGSNERDQVEWMTKYKKPLINPYLNHFKNLKHIVIGKMPSMTIINKN